MQGRVRSFVLCIVLQQLHLQKGRNCIRKAENALGRKQRQGAHFFCSSSVAVFAAVCFLYNRTPIQATVLLGVCFVVRFRALFVLTSISYSWHLDWESVSLFSCPFLCYSIFIHSMWSKSFLHCLSKSEFKSGLHRYHFSEAFLAR